MRAKELALLSAAEGETSGGAQEVKLHTNRGVINCRRHRAPGKTAVLWVFGAGGGLGGPAGGLYIRLAEELAQEGVSSLRLDYRRPGDLVECVLDVLAGLAYLEADGLGRVVLVGHSFGGAVVIQTGARSEAVIAVAALSSQTYGAAEVVGQVSPRPLLLLHGTADEVLPARCSEDLFQRAAEPKQLILYPGCRHGLDDCRAEVDRDLGAWLRRVV